MHQSLLRADSSRKPWRRTRPAWMLGAGLFTCVLLGAGIAIADIPDGNTINTCRNNTTFALRVIDVDKGQTCKVGAETPLSWTNWNNRGTWSATTAYRAGDVVQYLGSSYIAAKGPAVGTKPGSTPWALIVSRGATGATGLQGPAGPAGKDGAMGPAGPAGKDGATGPQGPDGPPGKEGAMGPQGDTGAQGDQGPKGDTGAQGDQGPKGDTGAQGDQGPQGVPGKDGLPGPSGVNGTVPLVGSTLNVTLTGTWQFIPAGLSNLTVSAGQTVLGTANVLLSGSANNVQIDLCVADITHLPIPPKNPLVIGSVGAQSGFGASEVWTAAVLGAPPSPGALYSFGFCVRGTPWGTVSASASGWLLVTTASN